MSEAELVFAYAKGVTREGRQCVRLMEPFAWRGIVVPAGFISDFASVPAIFDGLIPVFGEYAPATTVHDFLYATQGLFGYFTRKECDDLLLSHMKELGVPWWKRQLMHRAVRLGGSPGWGS